MSCVFFVLYFSCIFLFPFINDFGNFPTNPCKRKKSEENKNLIKSRMIRENNNIEHCNKQQDKPNQNCISHFCILHYNCSNNPTNRRSNSR